jgi:hypothetical protein
MPHGYMGYGDIVGGADDIIGYDIATGNEVDALLGAMIATGAAPAAAAAALAAPGASAASHALAMRHAAMMKPRTMTRSREYTCGFASAPVAIAAATTSVLKAQPQVPFKPRRLIIPSDVAGALTINNIIVGKNPGLVSADPVSARAFTELGVGVDLNLDTAQISQTISLSLTNQSGASVSVTPTLIGTAME